MADVRAFRGVTYDADRVDLAAVISTPYDVISSAQQEAYYARDPHNIVRVILNRAEPATRYAEAGSTLREWLDDGALQRDAAPCLYVHRQAFERHPGDPGSRVSRLGLLAAVRLEPWAAGAVRPHEHTMPGPKQDRLELMRATAADTEPIWAFHPDPERAVLSALESIAAEPAHLRAAFRPAGEEQGGAEIHELWRVSYPATVERLVTAASSVQLYIADGHHRYETALLHAEEVGGGPDDASRFKLMLLSAIEDPGLLVLPTHRLLRIAAGRSIGAFVAHLRTLDWEVEQFDSLSDLTARLARPAETGLLGFGVVMAGRYSYLEGHVPPANLVGLAPSIAALDVGVLHEGVLRPLLGIGPAELAAGEVISYSRDAAEVERLVTAGDWDAGILTRAPTLLEVQAVADAGENMPQKSTYFWPKPASGLVMMLQPPGEGL